MTGPAILVTGGAGFIGAHCCKALNAAGYYPVVYDNLSTGNIEHVRWGPFVLADLRDRVALNATMAHYKITAVMHVAASAYVGQSVRDPAAYHDNNIGSMIALLDICRRNRISSFVFSSSCSVYGSVATLPIRENTHQLPTNPYGFTKLVGERMLREQAVAYRMRPAILRYFNAAGADPDGAIGEVHRPETHLIPLALLAAAGHSPPLPILGTDYDTPDGSCIRDFIHVDDLARAHVLALRYLLNGGAPLTLNLGSGRGTSVLEVMSAVERVTGRAVPHVNAPRRAGDPPILVANPHMAEERLGFVVRHGEIEKIIAHAAPWFGHQVPHA